MSPEWKPTSRPGSTREGSPGGAGPGRTPPVWGHVVRACVAAVVLVALAGCSAGGGSVGGDSTTAERAADADAPLLRDEAARGGSAVDGEAHEQSDDSADAQGPVNRTTVQARAVIRTGEVALVTGTMNRARAEIDALLGRHGGYVASEDTHNDRAGRPTRSVLVLRVPEPAFDTVMGALGGIGRTQRSERRAEDVTTKVIDVDTRVRTQEAGLARLQRFLRQAVNIDDMIRIESEIATRQADLESLQAQQKYLRDQTAMSTVTVRLRTPASPPPVEEGQAGFLAGLAEGWAALKTVLVGAATVAGVVLPFTVATALLAVPLWWVARTAARRRPRGVPVAASGPAASQDA